MNQAKDIAFEVLPYPPCYLGEGPLWDDQRNTFCWVDILDGILLEYHPENNQVHKMELQEPLGAVALFPDGDFLVAAQSGIYRILRDSGVKSFLCHPEQAFPDNRYNDGKCDPLGRFWIGSMAKDHSPECGNLHLVFNDFKTLHQLSEVSISNGLAWNIPGNKMYYIDSPTRKVWAFDLDTESGTLSNRRIAISIPESEGVPDGMTLDREGMLWIGHWDGWQVARWNPETGEKLLGLKLPAAQITSCTFGGPNLTDLYITSAREGLGAADLETQPLAGSVFIIKNCGYQGWPTDRFGKPNTIKP